MRRVVPATGWRIVAAALGALLVAAAYLRDLGRNPYGFFADEALIGVQAQQLLDGTRPEGTFSPFYDHFGTVAGSLPVYATVPFVWMFGLNEFSVRLAVVVYLLLTCAVLLVLFRRLGLGTPWLPVLVFALSPIVIHLSRVNFGHTPSLLLLSLGYVLYVRAQARVRPRPWLALAAGLVTGFSAYGYPGFYVATPLFLGAVVVTETFAILARRGMAAPEGREATRASPTKARFVDKMKTGRWPEVGRLAGFAAGGLVALAPIVHRARTDPDFVNRFEAKDTAGHGLFSIARLETMVENYPKYYGIDFLFRTGDRGLPGAFIQRHTVDGAGLLSPVALPLLVLGLLAFLVSWRCDRARPFAPFMLLAFLLPLPDLITTTADQPPYSFAMFTGVLAVPFIVAWGLEALGQGHAARVDSSSGARSEDAGGARPPTEAQPLRSILALVTSTRFVTTLVVVSGFFFVFSTYARYPDGSSGFWGWQAGPREMIGYYVDHRDEYDAFVMEGAFNEPAIFLDFYIDDPDLRPTASIGGTDALDPSRRQLFGVSRETFEERLDQSAWTVRQTILYPNGEVAFYLIEFVHP